MVTTVGSLLSDFLSNSACKPQNQYDDGMGQILRVFAAFILDLM